MSSTKKLFLIILLSTLAVNLFASSNLVFAQESEVLSVKTIDSYTKVDVSTGEVTISKDGLNELSLTADPKLLETVDKQVFEQSKGALNFSNADVELSTYKIVDGLEMQAKIFNRDFLAKTNSQISYTLNVKGYEFWKQPALDEELNAKDYDFLNSTHAIIKGKVFIPQFC